MHGARDLHEIARRCLLDLDAEGGAPVDAIEPVLPGWFQADFGDIPQAQPVLSINNESANLLHRLETPHGADVDLAPALHDISAGDGEVLVRQLIAHLERLNPVRLEPRLIQLDAYLLARLAPHVNRAHALDPLQFRPHMHVEHLVGIDETLAEVGAHPHHRPVVLVPLAHVDALNLIGQFRHETIHAITQRRVGLMHVRAWLEFDVGPGAAPVGAGSNLGDAGNGGDRLFHGPCEFLFHLFRTGIGITDPDVQPVTLHAAGEQSQWNTCVGDVADDQRGDDDHDHRHGPIDTEARQPVAAFVQLYTSALSRTTRE